MSHEYTRNQLRVHPAFEDDCREAFKTIHAFPHSLSLPCVLVILDHA